MLIGEEYEDISDLVPVMNLIKNINPGQMNRSEIQSAIWNLNKR